jgi:hypothetical protein
MLRKWGRLATDGHNRARIEEVTDRWCKAIKNVAAYMGQDQTMEVLYDRTGRRPDHSSEPASLTTGESCLSLRRPLVG